MPDRRDGDGDGMIGDGTKTQESRKKPVVLRDFDDPVATRKAIFESTLGAARTLPAVATRLHSLTLSDVTLDGPESVSLERQKRAILEGGTIERRLRGTFTLKDLTTGQDLAQKITTLAHIPYLTDRGTYINKGSEYSLSSQMRLKSGVYSRRKANGELESHVNTTPGAGRSHRIGLDPESGKFHIEVGQARLPLTPALHALGATVADLRQAWGSDLATANQREDSESVLRRLHSKLAYPGSPPPEGSIADAVAGEFARMKLDPEVTTSTLGAPHETVTKETLLAATKKLLAINRGEAEPDDRDHLAYMTAHGPEDLFAEKISRVKGPLHKALWRAARAGNLDALPPGILTPAVRGALLDSGLGQPGATVNPSMVMDQVGRASRMGAGGIASIDSIPSESRNVQPSHLGFIDSVWTPECYDSETEVMTDTGWVRWPEIDDATVRFACLVNGRLEWHRPEALHQSDYVGPLYGATNKVFEYLVTPNHRLWDKPEPAKVYAPVYRIETAEAAFGKTRRFQSGGHLPSFGDRPAMCYFELPPIPLCANNQRQFHPMPIGDWAEFLGWFLAEGSYVYDTVTQQYRVDISQDIAANPENYTRIAELLSRLFAAWSFHDKGFCVAGKQIAAYFRQFGFCDAKFIPVEAFDYPVAARSRLLEALLAGDGRRNRRDKTQITQFCSTSRRLADDFQRLAFGLGIASRIVFEPDEREEQYLGCYVVHLHARTEKQAHKRDHYCIEYTGKIYCATVPGGLLYVRRHDKCGHWSGNSMRAGVDMRVSSGVKKGSDGRLYAPFRDVRTGETAYKHPGELANKVVAFPGELERLDAHEGPGWDAEGRPIRARGQLRTHVAVVKDGRLQTVPRSEVDYELPHFEKSFSPVANLVPMKSAIKPQRAAMAGRMLTQALSLIDPESPLVRSGVPGRLGVSFEEEHGQAMGAPRAKKSGVVSRAEADRIVIRHDDGTKVEHELHQHFPYNRKSGQHQTALVRHGQRVAPGDILARSNYTDGQGVTALGKNTRVAYMPHGGFNYEDANVISESMARRLSSDHYYQHHLEHEDGVVTGRDPHTAIFPGTHDRTTLAKFDEEGVIKPGTEVSTGHPLILAAKKRDRTYGSIHPGRKASFSDATVTWDHHNPGVVTDVARTKKGTLVVVKSHAAAEIGDKISGRFGDKGVISRIVPDDQMPRGEDGRPFEALLNPLGIISRCYDDQTEFLTSRGWKRGLDVLKQDQLLCFDPQRWLESLAGLSPNALATTHASQAYVWHSQVEPMHVAAYDGKLLHYAHDRVDLAVTPNHTMWARSVSHGPLYVGNSADHWEATTAAAMSLEDHVGLIAKRYGRTNLQRRVPDSFQMVELLAMHWHARDYRRFVYCPTVPTGFVVIRRHGKVSISGNTNPAQMIEASLGKVAERTGQPYAVQDFAGGDHNEFARAELARHGMKDTETVHDPEHNRDIPGIFTGNRYLMKLEHTSESKGQGRGIGGYTAEGTPARGGPAGSKRVSLMDSSALLSHGATEFLRDIATRGQDSSRYWQQVMSGHTPPEPETPPVYKKFFEMLKAAGLNPKRDGTRTHLLALTNRDVDTLAGTRELKNAETVDWKAGLKPIPGGLFDPSLTGGGDGNSWSAIKLHEPMVNPAFEEPVRRMLGLTRAKFRDVLSGRAEVGNHGAGPRALESALKAINIDQSIDLARREIKSGRKGERDDAVRKLGYLKSAKEHGLHPSDWILNRVPVLPPRFRPVSMMQGGLPMVADPNLLYKELHDANDNLKHMTGKVDDVSEERLAVYDAFKGVTGLGDPLHPKNQERQVTGILKKVFGEGGPKTSMVQRKLIGSTVDTVGRAVISPDPGLDIDQVGIPENHAWEIYKPFLVRRLVRQGVDRLQAAKAVMDRTPMARKALDSEVEERPVVIGRAPTLHRYSLMAARPVIMHGDTLRISPLVTKGYGADFDGDTMSIHVPASSEAVKEAYDKMLPSRNLLSVNDFSAHQVPSQEYTGGLYSAAEGRSSGKRARTFATTADAKRAWQRGELGVDDPVEIAGS